MKRTRNWIFPTLIILIGLTIGWWIGRSASTIEPSEANSQTQPPKTRLDSDQVVPPMKFGKRPDSPQRFDPDAANRGALPGQRWITFSDRDALNRFLAKLAGSGIARLDSIDALNTIRVGFLDPDALAELLDGTEESGYIYPVHIPGGGGIQDGALGFGGELIPWIGAPSDRSGWGSGVTVAVLDTGILDHSAFNNRLFSENFIPPPDDLSTQSGHATAVASLIASELGLAPDASLISYRVADEDGRSDTFTLAKAVIAATEAGAHIINISMGSNGNSAILNDAIQHAQEAGVIIVASAGNEGQQQVAYPAAYQGVVAVGAIDANGSILDFSNSGDITIAAPGLDIASAWTEDQTILFTGTSASAPVVAGAIAAVMTQEKLTAQAALDLLLANANESGAPGNDTSFGTGTIDLGRSLRSDEAGQIDIALASNFITTAENDAQILQVTIENRGTSAIVNAPVSVTTPAGKIDFNISSLAAGKIKTFDIPFDTGTFPPDQEIRIDSSVTLSDGLTDLNPSNNRRVDVYAPQESP